MHEILFYLQYGSEGERLMSLFDLAVIIGFPILIIRHLIYRYSPEGRRMHDILGEWN